MDGHVASASGVPGQDVCRRITSQRHNQVGMWPTNAKTPPGVDREGNVREWSCSRTSRSDARRRIDVHLLLIGTNFVQIFSRLGFDLNFLFAESILGGGAIFGDVGQGLVLVSFNVDEAL